MIPRRFWVAAALAVLLAGCQSSPGASVASAPVPNSSAVPGVTAPGFRLPEGAGCAGDVARFRAIIDNDLQTGHTTAGVHGRMSAELDQADTACKAGRDGEARAMVRATRSRFGYPG